MYARAVLRVIVIVLLTALLVMPVPIAGAAPEKEDLGAAVGPLRLVPTGASPLSVHGLHSFFGTIELEPASDGLAVVNELGLEQYLLGLNEVPTSWPVEALRAQAVAARTYALWTLARPPAGSAAVYGFDICATVDCQVFSGADVVNTSGGSRWARAVADTRGEAVLYEGSPILARYHSTSGGQTFANEQVFPEEGPYPYLQPVPSTTETGSSLYRWRVDFRLSHLQKMLEAAGWWEPRLGRLTAVRTVASDSGLHYPDVLFEGTKGAFRETAEELRVVLRDLAPSMFPALYPSPAPTSSGRLPETFPSNRVEIGTRGSDVHVIGRGWGHGVGMSQWGAHGLALAGASYVDILTHYYRGTTVAPAEAPEWIEVGVAWGRDEVVVDGAFRIVDGRGKTIVADALGMWRFRWDGTGSVGIAPPEGYGLPLQVGLVEAPESAAPGELVFFEIALSRPARLRTVTTGPELREPSEPSVTVERAGRRRIAWTAPPKPGRYRVRITASAGASVRTTDTVTVEVLAPDGSSGESPGPGSFSSRPSDGGDSGAFVPLLWGALAFLVVVIGGFAISAARMKT